jgi:hypothetical protein
MEHTEDSEGTENAYRLDADIDLGDGWVDALRIGVRRAEREQNINWSTYNWGSVQPLWGLQSDEAIFLTQGRWQGGYQTVDWSSNLVGGGVFGGGTFIHPAFADVSNYQASIDRYAGHSNSYVPLGMRTGCPVDANSPGGLYCPVEEQRVTEGRRRRVHDVQVRQRRHQVGQRQRQGQHRRALGHDRRHRLGGVQFPTFTPYVPSAPAPGQPPAPIPPNALTPAEDIAFMNAATSPQSGGGSHDNVLPSLNVRFGLTDEQFLRFAVSRALSRPDMGLYKNYIGISQAQPACGDGSATYAGPNCTGDALTYTPQYTASAGNPASSPTTADQLDLTYEWYFSSTGSITTALFYKKFNDYVQYGNYTRDFTNNGVTRTVSINGPITG